MHILYITYIPISFQLHADIDENGIISVSF